MVAQYCVTPFFMCNFSGTSVKLGGPQSKFLRSYRASQKKMFIANAAHVVLFLGLWQAHSKNTYVP